MKDITISILLIILMLLGGIIYLNERRATQAHALYKRGLIIGIGIGKMAYIESEYQSTVKALYHEEIAEAEKLFVDPNTVIIHGSVSLGDENVPIPDNIMIELKQ